jgi:hypothetical protein
MLLVAARPSVAAALRGALGESVRMTSVSTLGDAVKHLQKQSDVAMILCTVYFDDSQMFDLMRLARVDYPGIPFVCCRFLESDLARISVDALTIAAKTLGAVAFVDMPGLAAEFGPGAANQHFQNRVFAHLPARI